MTTSAERDPLLQLSPRETEVLNLLLEGKTAREISRIVGVKPTSVQTYRNRIMTKLETRNIVDLVRLAIRQGLISA
jgi:two-component system, NarL family, invasion response regulator UvrY